MSVSEEIAALRADLERMQKEKEADAAENEEKFERLRRERPLGPSFDEQGGGGSADRRGTAAPTMGSMWTRGVRTGGGLGQSLPYVPRGTVSKFPMECPPYVCIAWERHFHVFITNQGLGHTISPDAPQIAVISCPDDAYLFDHFGEALVTEHRRTWGHICEATAGAPFENHRYECHSVSDALRAMREWALPLQPAERYLLTAELEGVQFMGDEDPKFFFERISRLESTMRAVGIAKSDSEIVQFILRKLPGRPSHPHALVVGRGFRDGGAVGGGSMPRQQQQLQQHWSRDSGIPWQQQQQLQHWFHDGGIPRQQQQQQQWSRGGGNPHQHQRSSHTVPPARPARQQPSRGIHRSGGDGEHGRDPLSAPATEAVLDTSVFPAASSKAVAEAPTSSAGAASTAVPAAAPATGGTVFPTTSVGGAARAPAPADETAALKAASTASGTVPSATPLRGAVGARESSAGAASSDAVSKAAPATSGTVTSATPLRGAVGARELSAGAAPSDVAAEAFPLAVCYNNNSNNSSKNISSSNNGSNNNNSSSSNKDTTTTCAVALLRSFDPGRGCQRDARIGAVIGLDLPFDRGKV